jgi:hypothetical protein
MIPDNPQIHARAAGLAYLVIIVLGIWSEVAVRSGIVVPGDAAVTAANVAASSGLLRLSLAADMVMVIADIALAVLLFALLAPVSRLLAAMAAAFRLIQAAVIAAALLNQHAALLLADAPGDNAAGIALQLALQADGYDLGLVFFGVNSLITGWLVWRAPWLPRVIGGLVAAAGIVYLAGSGLVFLAPGAAGAFQPAYVICLVAELAFCLWLIVRGVDMKRWREAAPEPR